MGRERSRGGVRAASFPWLFAVPPVEENERASKYSPFLCFPVCALLRCGDLGPGRNAEKVQSG